MPYLYVLDAYEYALNRRQKKLHELEAPVALQTSLIANTNRDPKKTKKPFSMEDFFLYQPRDTQNIPKSSYGSAGMKLLEMGLLPAWALFIYRDLKQSAAGSPPQLLAFLHKSAIILAPLVKTNTVKGMLICEDKVYNTKIEMQSPCGQSIQVFIPKLEGCFIALENVELEISL